MPSHKSAEKCLRQQEVRRARNHARQSQLKTAIKNVLVSLRGKDADKARQALANAIRVIDKAHTKGIIHKNNAARKQSRLTRKVNTLLAATTAAEVNS